MKRSSRERADIARQQPDSPTLSVEEARHLLGCGRGLAYELIRTGRIPAIRLGRKVRVPRAALMRMLDGSIEAGASAAMHDNGAAR